MDYKKKYDELVDAIEYYTILWEFTLDKDNPKDTIKQLLDIETAAAVDPAVSKAARDLLMNSVLYSALVTIMDHGDGQSAIWAEEALDSLREQVLTFGDW